MHRTRRAISAHKNSLQSRLSSILTEPLPPQPLDLRDALLEREGGHILAVEARGLLEAVRHANDALDHASSIAQPGLVGEKGTGRRSARRRRRYAALGA